MDDGFGIRMKRHCIVYSEKFSNDIHNKLKSLNEFIIELSVETKNLNSKEVGYIVTYSKDKMQNNFAIAQRYKDLLIFFRTTSCFQNEKINHIEIKNVFSSNNKIQIIVAGVKGCVNIYLNGVLKKKAILPGDFSNWYADARIRFGNDDSGKYSWDGSAYRYAVYDCAITQKNNIITDLKYDSDCSILKYEFKRTNLDNIIKDTGAFRAQQDLLIPDQFKVVGKSFLSFPNTYSFLSFEQIKDVLYNIMGFCPLGFFLTLLLFSKNINLKFIPFYVTSLGFILSMFIEILQIYLPLRSSSSLDLVTNTLGTFVGVIICLKFTERVLVLRKMPNNFKHLFL